MRFIATVSLALFLGACGGIMKDSAGNEIASKAECDKYGGAWKEFINASGGRPSFKWCEPR